MNEDFSSSDKVEQIKGLLSDLESTFARKKTQGEKPDICEEKLEDYQAMRTRALKYIGADRGKAYGQVFRVLAKEFSEIARNEPELIDTVIVSLKQDAYLDEKLCGRRLIKRHSKRKQKSAGYIVHLLRQQGISESVITDLKAEILPDEETAEAYFKLKLEEWDYQQPEKIMRHFASRGYSSGITLKIMRKYANGEE